MGSLGAFACRVPFRLPGAGACARAPKPRVFKYARVQLKSLNPRMRGTFICARARSPSSAMPPRRTRSGSARAKPGFFQRHSNVYAYVPNLIGYARVVLAAVALRVAFDDVPTSLALYLLSFVCDELDGRFARMFDQCSEFGKLLDMVRVVFPIRTPPNPPIHAPIDLLPPIERCINHNDENLIVNSTPLLTAIPR